MRRIRRFAAAAVLLGAAVLAGCRKDGDPVRQTLDRIAKGARDRNASSVAAQLSADYRDAAGNGRSDIKRTLASYFASYELVDVTLSGVVIERAEGAARARFRADLSGQPRKAAALAGLLPSSASYRFDLRLIPDGSAWKVVWASWEVVER